jgi:hypothetical protein
MVLKNRGNYPPLRKISGEYWRIIQENSWKPKGFTGEIGQKSDGPNLVMKTQIFFILLPPRIIEEIPLHLLSTKMAHKSPTMNTKLPLYGIPIKTELEYLITL